MIRKFVSEVYFIFYMYVMKLVVDASQRFAKMRAHTATHLLHATLTTYFPLTKQEWSLVDEDYLRFDFSADRLLTWEELREIEDRINMIIYQAYPVDIQEMSFDEAKQLWAKAFFEEKYTDRVRVVRVYDHNQNPISLELCWWTHVSTTKDIWCFSILAQETVASWIKRIVAVTGPKVVERVHELQSLLDMTINKLGIKTYTQLEDKLEKLLKDYESTTSLLTSLETKLITQALQQPSLHSHPDFDQVIHISSDIAFKHILPIAKQVFTDQTVLIYNDDGNFLLLTRSWVSAKQLIQKLWLSWWGNDMMVQGRDLDIQKKLFSL